MGIFSIVFKMTVNCVHSSEWPQGGDSIEYTQYTFCNMRKKKKLLNYPKPAGIGVFPRDLRTSSKQPW